MTLVSTEQLMEEQRLGAAMIISMVICIPACCCFWIPMLFFMGAANVLTSCENYDSFTLWMRSYGLAPMCCHIFMQLMVSAAAFCRIAWLFKLMLRGQLLASAVSVGLLIWGWIEWAKTDEEMCVGDADINPRTLALVFLIMGSICAPSVSAFVVYRACCGNLNDQPSPEGK